MRLPSVRVRVWRTGTEWEPASPLVRTAKHSARLLSYCFSESTSIFKHFQFPTALLATQVRNKSEGEYLQPFLWLIIAEIDLKIV